MLVHKNSKSRQSPTSVPPPLPSPPPLLLPPTIIKWIFFQEVGAEVGQLIEVVALPLPVLVELLLLRHLQPDVVTFLERNTLLASSLRLMNKKISECFCRVKNNIYIYI